MKDKKIYSDPTVLNEQFVGNIGKTIRFFLCMKKEII